MTYADDKKVVKKWMILPCVLIVVAAESWARAAAVPSVMQRRVLVTPSAAIFATHRFSRVHQLTALCFDEPVLFTLPVCRFERAFPF
jgi:hypothetical protein